MKKQLRFGLAVSLVALIGSVASADSLWAKGGNTGQLFTSVRSPRIGDVITIYISESTSALQEAGTKTGKQASLGANYSNIWDQVGDSTSETDQLRKNQRYNLGGEENYNGVGQTSRKSQVKAVVTAVVTEIMENGNLYLVGEHRVKVNEENETVRISGIIRPEDVTAQNTIFSYQMAQVEVSVKGAGVVADKQNPGFLTRMFGWLC
jgi:flagellar L-ring protein precursor FlgH